MLTTLILLRGNAASGKTSLAHLLCARLGPENVLLISQDVVRREMLHVRDTPDNLAIPLLAQLVRYGNGRVPVVILEGILARSRYAPMLTALAADFPHVLAYYFDLPLTTTLDRHRRRPQAARFSTAQLQRWWLPHDTLIRPYEHRFTATATLATECARVLTDLSQVTR